MNEFLSNKTVQIILIVVGAGLGGMAIYNYLTTHQEHSVYNIVLGIVLLAVGGSKFLSKKK